MKLIATAFRCSALLLAVLATSVQGQGGTRRVIVTLRSTSGEAALRAPGAPPVTGTELAQIASRLDRDLPSFRERGRAPFAGILVAEVSAAEATQLEADPNVAHVEEDQLWAPADGVPSLADGNRWAALRPDGVAMADEIPWGVARVTAPEVWAGGNSGGGVKVAVMDSGIDINHSDLQVVGGYNAVTRTASGYNDDLSICNGHGTHIAGTIAAKANGTGVVGIAPAAQLYSIKVFENIGGSCLAYTSSQIVGLNWAVTQGIRLVNVSIGSTSESYSYENAMQTAAAQGTYVVAAAGNSGGSMSYPGFSTHVIGVGALDSGNNRASFSSFGPALDFAAPGVGINSTMPGGGYGGKSGTSMATPHVVGVAALILAAQPGLSLDGLRQKLQDGALDLGSAGYDEYTGGGLVRAQNSLGGGSPPPPVPLTLAVSPASRSVSAQVGAAVAGSNATVTLAGDNSSSTAWTAAKRKSWTTLTTGSGTGSGTVAWSRSTSGLAAGTYVDTITVSAAGVASRTVIDSLVITAAPVPLTLAVSPASRSVTAQVGTAVGGSNATVTLAGDNSSTTAWTAAKRKSWTTLTTGSGTGSGTVAWSRSTSGLAAGTYVDTITVSVAGVTPRIVIDSLVVTAAPVPLTLAVSPASRSVTAQVGTAVGGSNATVTLAGDNSSTTAWTAAKRKSWTTLTTGSGTGSGTVAWSRSSAGLSAGTYVDTITVSVAGVTPRIVIDSLVVTAAPVPLTLAVSPASRSVTAERGSGVGGSNAAVPLSGDNSSTTAWTAAKRQSWTTLTTGSGTGSGTLAWSRSTSGLAAGTYVDTITVSAAGVASRTVIDSLVVTAAPVPLTMALSPASRSVTAQVNTAVAGSFASITLTGDNANTATWSATKRQSWTTLTNGSGTATGTVSWSRSTAGLAAGTYVDTITVTVVGLTPRTVIDSMVITAAPVPLTLAVSPASRNVSAQVNTAAPTGTASVALAGDGASTTAWIAAKRKSWTTLTTGSGTGSGTLGWSRSTTGLVAGTYVDTITVSAVGVAPQTLIDSLVVTAAPVALALSVSPASRSVTTQVNGTVPDAAASVWLTGDGASAAAWSASKRKSWTTLTTGSGTGSGTVAWSRSTAGLAAGTYVDTITVSASGTASRTVVDSLIITNAPIPTTLAVSPASRKVTIEAGATAASGSGSVTLAGDAATSTSWTASKRKAWTTLTSASGTGSGSISWNRNTSTLAAGTYVDTITVTAGSLTGRIVDSIVVTPATTSPIAVKPKGKRARYLTQAGSASSVDISRDSALVEGTVVAGESSTWIASATGSRIVVETPTGQINQYVRWERRPVGTGPAVYIDTIRVQLTRALDLEAIFVDTLEVVAVQLPEVGIAVEELVRGGRLSEDQRLLFDRDGNRNGIFDLGDFLAWVDRASIRLSPAQMAQLQSVPLVRPREQPER
ncbi:MAG: S8 family peptidase [Gemmatimonadales bacterium]|nr:S8 family peptidase [Gemmatimonadales bacterium]